MVGVCADGELRLRIGVQPLRSGDLAWPMRRFQVEDVAEGQERPTQPVPLSVPVSRFVSKMATRMVLSPLDWVSHYSSHLDDCLALAAHAHDLAHNITDYGAPDCQVPSQAILDAVGALKAVNFPSFRSPLNVQPLIPRGMNG